MTAPARPSTSAAGSRERPATARLPADRPRGPGLTYWIKLLVGPLAFLAVLAAGVPLPPPGRIVLATFVWAVCWWIAQPVPWAITTMLPLLVYPATGVMNITETAQLYGQTIFFWIMGTVLMGYAIEKHGLGRRFALMFLSLPGAARRTSRLAFAYMSATGLISTVVSDAATIAMMMPIGLSLVDHVQTMAGQSRAERTRLAEFITLGTFYAAVAGGTATMVGIPHNAIAVALVEKFAGRQIGWFDWMTAGVPVFVALLVAFYVILRIMLPPEIDEIPTARAFLDAERAQLGPLTSNERRVLGVFAAMVVLFTLPSALVALLGPAHGLTRAVDRAVPIWAVPPAVMLLLFAVPARGGDGGPTLLTWKDAERQTPWNILILVTGAVGMADALTRFGFVELMSRAVAELGVGPVLLPYIAALLVVATTDFISGAASTTLYTSIFVPAALQVGFNPASMGILIANVALGLTLPWAGAAAATAFALGRIGMLQMIKVGIVATLTFAVVAATLHLLMAPFV
jgi:sodium-dependent dicarboxylate transporter 2/3/5